MNHEPNQQEREPTSEELLLQRYVDGELRPQERQDFEAKLIAEPSLRRRVEELEQTRRLLGEERRARGEPAPLGVGFADRVWGQLRADLSAPAIPERPPVLRLVQTWTLLAASLAVLLGAALLLWRPAAPAALQADPALHQKLEALDRRAEAEAAREKPPAATEESAEKRSVEEGRPESRRR